MSNGQLTHRQLSPIPGGHLRNDAARAWNAMNAESIRRGWGRLEIVDSYRPLGHPGDYRAGRWSQWAAWERYQAGGNLAAEPGISNHGNGLAVDVSQKTRWVVDRIGRKYGFSKGCSDAKGEWWHISYNPGCTHATWKPGPQPLRRGDHGKRVARLQWRLRVWGYHHVPGPHEKHRGHYGAATRRAVIAFQKRKHLTADGVVGAQTMRALMRNPK